MLSPARPSQASLLRLSTDHSFSKRRSRFAAWPHPNSRDNFSWRVDRSNQSIPRPGLQLERSGCDADVVHNVPETVERHVHANAASQVRARPTRKNQKQLKRMGKGVSNWPPAKSLGL